MKITDNCPETQGASMQAFHPPLFKHSSKQRAVMQQDPECSPSVLTASNNREQTPNQSFSPQELEKREAS